MTVSERGLFNPNLKFRLTLNRGIKYPGPGGEKELATKHVIGRYTPTKEGRLHSESAGQFSKKIFGKLCRNAAFAAIFHASVVCIAILVQGLEWDAEKSFLDAGYMSYEAAHISMVTHFVLAISFNGDHS